MVLASWATRVARRSLVGASCCVQTSVHMRRLSVAAPAHGPASCSPKRAVSQGHYLPLFVRPAALFRASLGERTYSTALEWKPPLKVITYPDPRLRAPNRTIETFDGTLERLASDMLDAMYQCVVWGCFVAWNRERERVLTFDHDSISHIAPTCTDTTVSAWRRLRLGST